MRLANFEQFRAALLLRHRRDRTVVRNCRNSTFTLPLANSSYVPISDIDLTAFWF